MPRMYSIRLPVHGFVEFTEWERDIINHPVFQRLRRIRQLALSEHVYPGSTHTRFEHSLGVMHLATRLYDAIVAKNETIIKDRLGYKNVNDNRFRSLVRLAGLLHDVGHSAFSHAGEDLMPLDESKGRALRHEDYTWWLIKSEMRDVIDDHPFNVANNQIRAEEVADFYSGRATRNSSVVHLLWRDLVAGTLDADRMDYLLRDGYHCGVDYGRFDLERIIDCITIGEDKYDNLRIAIEEDGRHAAEGLILARYFMFIQVYFHKTRRAYDHHAQELVNLLVQSKPEWNGKLPSPTTPKGRREFRAFDDWEALEFLKASDENRHKQAIFCRKHDRLLYCSPEVADTKEIEKLEQLHAMLCKKGIDAWTDDERKSWYKVDRNEISIAEESGNGSLIAPVTKPLSKFSAVVKNMSPCSQFRIYVPQDQLGRASKLLSNLK